MKRLALLTVLLVSLIGGLAVGSLLPRTAAQSGTLAPDGQPGETYLAPFPLTIKVDGDLSDWTGVPTVSLSRGDSGVTFAAAADDQFLYLMADVLDNNIIAGQHDQNYWNEDSVEFYLNGTGDLTLTSYKDGVAQLTISPVNIDLAPDKQVLAGVKADTVGAVFKVVKTDKGWAAEVSVPLKNKVWEIKPQHGGEMGFQVHLNAASEKDRDTKLIWSIYDTSDQSYQNPSLFGRLIFFEIGQTALPAAAPAEQKPLLVADFEGDVSAKTDEYGNGIGFVPWGDTGGNVTLEAVPAEGDLALPDQQGANKVLKVSYDIATFGGFSHVFTDGKSWLTQDWSAYTNLDFWLYGANTGGTIQVDLFDNRAPGSTTDTAERWFYRFKDDFTGWKQFSIPFADFQRRTDWQPGGTPDDGLGLTEVSGYAFGFPAGVGKQVNYLDNVSVSGSSGVAPKPAAEKTPVPEVVTTPAANVNYNAGVPWKLVWSDEFNGESGTPIDSKFWTCETGGEGWGNQEWEYYTDSTNNAMQDGAGNLSIIARQETPADSTCWYGECKYTSARCITQAKFAFTYGRVEARMKLPYGQGIWPAFWMLGANFADAGWPDSGEIDIMEYIGKEPQKTFGTAHGPGYSGAAGIGKSFDWGEDVANEYHIWSVEWEPNVIRWYVDNLEFFTLTSADIPPGRQWVFDHDFFLLLNLAVGGGWPGYPDETTVFPQTYSIDWVRVYQRAAE